MPPNPLELFLALKLLKINSAGKISLQKSDENWCPLPQKISELAPDMEYFQKACLITPVSEFKRLCI